MSYKSIMKGTLLPSEYAELEYLESSGTQYINAGSLPSIAKFEYSCKYLTDIISQGAFGYNYSDSGTQRRQGLTTNSSGKITLGYGDGEIGYWQPYSAEANSTYVYYVDFIGKTASITKNGTVIDTTTFSNDTRTNRIDMYIMACNNNTASPISSSAIFYSFKVWDSNSVLIRNFIPVKRNSDSVLGMYDIVNGVFYTNAGSGTFTAGPEVLVNVPTYKSIMVTPLLPSAYTQLEYLQSTGTQYIDTEFEATSETLTMKTQISKRTNSSQTNGNYFGFCDDTTDTKWCTVFNSSSASTYANPTFWCGTSQGKSCWNTSIADELHDIEIIIDGTNKQYTTKDGGNVIVSSTYTDTFLDDPAHYMLFTCGSQTATTQRLSAFKMGYHAIYQDGTIVRNFIPAKRNQDSTLGMYDLAWDGSVYGCVDLGTLTWASSTFGSESYHGFYATIDRSTSSPINMYTVNYPTMASLSISGLTKAITGFNHTGRTNNICIYDIDCVDMTAAEFKAAMSGVKLYYQRTTDTEFHGPFFTNAGTGVFTAGPENIEYVKYPSYKSCMKRLPSEYTEFDSAIFDSTSAIIFPVSMIDGQSIEQTIKFESASYRVLIGYGTSSSQYWGKSADDKIQIDWSTSSVSALDKHKVIYKTDLTTSIAYLQIDDEEIHQYLLAGEFSSYLVAIGGYRGDFTLYGDLIVRNASNEITHRFVPCKNTSDVVGYYDLIDDVFTTGTFTPGSEVYY